LCASQSAAIAVESMPPDRILRDVTVGPHVLATRISSTAVISS